MLQHSDILQFLNTLLNYFCLNNRVVNNNCICYRDDCKWMYNSFEISLFSESLKIWFITIFWMAHLQICVNQICKWITDHLQIWKLFCVIVTIVSGYYFKFSFKLPRHQNLDWDSSWFRWILLKQSDTH